MKFIYVVTILNLLTSSAFAYGKLKLVGRNSPTDVERSKIISVVLTTDDENTFRVPKITIKAENGNTCTIYSLQNVSLLMALKEGANVDCENSSNHYQNSSTSLNVLPDRPSQHGGRYNLSFD